MDGISEVGAYTGATLSDMPEPTPCWCDSWERGDVEAWAWFLEPIASRSQIADWDIWGTLWTCDSLVVLGAKARGKKARGGRAAGPYFIPWIMRFSDTEEALRLLMLKMLHLLGKKNQSGADLMLLIFTQYLFIFSKDKESCSGLPVLGRHLH